VQLDIAQVCVARHREKPVSTIALRGDRAKRSEAPQLRQTEDFNPIVTDALIRGMEGGRQLLNDPVCKITRARYS
jgi:hypothetical protein